MTLRLLRRSEETSAKVLPQLFLGKHSLAIDTMHKFETALKFFSISLSLLQFSELAFCAGSYHSSVTSQEVVFFLKIVLND